MSEDITLMEFVNRMGISEARVATIFRDCPKMPLLSLVQVLLAVGCWPHGALRALATGGRE